MDVFGGAPRFLAYPRPVVVQSGTDAVLKCQIGGDPRPAVIWERNNKKIDPQGRYRVFEDGNVYNLIITAVTIEDSGQYICKAKNSIGETYAAATLKVEGEAQEMELREENKPRFLIKPLSTRVGRGEDAVFSCKLWGNPRPEVVWEKDGRKLNEIFESTHFSVGYQDGGWFQLKIFKTRAPDGGVYTCKARNEFGEALAGAVLLVDAGPGHEEEGNRNGYTNGHWKVHQGKQRTGRQVPTRLKDNAMTKSTKVKMFAVTEGKHAKFRCFVTGKPKPEIIWRKDGRLILSGRRYLLYEDREGYFTLKVLYCKQKDNGVYVCAASNTAGQTLSAVHLSVKEPPVRFKQPLYDLEVWERDLAVLECEVPEDSVPITWYLEDRRLQPGAKYGMEEWGTKRRLTIRDIGVDDDGIYLCEMPDGGRSIAEVAVKGTILRKLPRKVDVLEGENAAFCVEVEKEEMDIHWYKDGIELRETHQTILKSFGRTHILVFVNTMPQDSGLVTFLVGRSKTSSQLRVKAARHCPPSCPVGVQINTERANAALLSWVSAPDSRKNPPSGYVLERQEVGTGSQEWLQCLTTDSATSVEILGDSVPCEADYRFRICSVNKYGKSNNVEFPRTVHLVPVARIQAPLQDALVPEGQDALFTIELSASVIGTWFLNGTQLQDDERYSLRRSRTHQSLRIRGVRDTDNGAEITFIAYGIRDSAALYIQAPLVKFSHLSEMDRNKFVEVGNPIVLYCELSDPAAPVHWYKNGVELQSIEGLHIQSEGTMRRIVIQSADFSHSGVYCCDAIDDVIRFNVEVEAPPVRFSAIPDAERSKSIQAGGPFVLQCELSDPSAQVYWYKDGSKLHPQTGVDVKAEGLWRKLVVHSAEVAHSGLYCCKTKGDAVTFSVEITASPTLPVRIKTLQEAERNKAVEVGEPIELRCEISDPNAPVTWVKDGVKLSEESGQNLLTEGSVRTLAFQSAMPSHAGIYICKTSHDAVQFYVDVKAPPLTFAALSEADQKMTVVAGSPIALRCALSDPSGQVSWYKDGRKLLAQSGVAIQSQGNLRSLVVPSAERVHTGVYRCESKDDDIQFSVEVKGLPVKFSKLQEKDRNRSIEEGKPLALSCELSHDPLAHVDWYKDGMKLGSWDKVEIKSDGLTRTLIIPSAESIHAGIYECSTSEDSIIFKVDVKGQSPRIMATPFSEKYKLIRIGSPIFLQCEVSDPAAQVSWFKDEVELFSKTGLDMKRDGTLRKLIIHSAKVSDSGLYSCSLADEAVTFHVDIEATPVRLSKLPEVARSKFVEAGCPVQLQCEASETAAQVHRHRDGERLLETSEYKIQTSEKLRELVIQSAEVRHSGLYSCEATDNHIQFKVDVAAVSEAERSESVEAGNLIRVHGEISDPAVQTCWYEDGIQSSLEVQSKPDEGALVMESSLSSCSVVYECKADDGDKDFKLKAPPVTFTDIPEKDLFRTAVEQQQLILSCEVSRTDGVVQWYKDGTEIQPSINVSMEAEGAKRNLIINSAKLSDTGAYTCRTGDNILIFKVNIREPPVMIVYPKEDVHLDRHVPEEIILSCELSRPNGAVGWFKDGQKLQESENIKLKYEGPYRRLKILSSRVEDSGEYVCDTADDSIFFHLNITEPPVQILSPSQSQMELCQQTSERMVLSCEISRPNAVVRWYRDGLEVEESENLLLEVDGVYRRLIIPETTVKDSAEYVCDTGDDSVTFFVNIAEPPVRFMRPRKMASRVEKVVGETLVLDCEVSRSNAEVTWKKNGEEVEDSRKVTVLEDGVTRQLTIHSVTVEDAGQYVCDAKDDVMDFNVRVQDLPVRILGKTDAKTEKQFLVSDDIILVCELSNANASVRWYKDGQLIDDSQRYCCEEQDVFRSLVVLNAGLEDSGEYSCYAGDDKMAFTITVREPPVQIIGNSGNPEHHVMVTGDDLILECEVSRANADVEWTRNGEALQPSDRIRIDSYGVVRKFVLSGLQPSDSGEYVCEAIDDKLVTVVEVQDPPAKFLNKKGKNNMSAYENESVTLCAVVSSERANIRWMKDGQLLNKDNIHISSEGKTHKLTINPLQLSDSGEYVCDVSTDEMYFILLVEEMKVKFVKRLENVISLKGKTLTLQCEVNKPKGDVQWLKDGKEMTPSRRCSIRAQGRERSLTIQQLTDEDAGQYVCESTDDRTAATVSIETPRVVEFIAELRNITIREGEDAVFKCVVSPADTTLVWRLNGKDVALNERTAISCNGLCHMLCISSCLVSESGTVTADAEGLESAAELTVQEQQALFTKKMAAVVAEEYSEATLEVEVSQEAAEVQWMRQGILIHPGAKYTLKHRGRTHSLTVHQVAAADRGAYSCETLHDRTQAQLAVEPRKISIKRGLTDIKTTERETASFEVELSHANVPGTWIRNGIQLKPTNHFRMSAKGEVHSLTISNLSVEDTGSFVFSVENLKTSARLVVKEPPVTVVRKLENQKVPDGSVISFDCELSRHNVDVKWMKDGVEVKPSKDVRIYAMGRKRFLQIMKCSAADSGVYACDAGDAATSCSVEVYERELLVLQGLEDLDIQEDQNAVFVCEISVEDVPGEWYRNGERIQPTSTVKIRQEGTKHFLLMCNVRPEDSGEIKFVARNSESVAYLEVEELPVNIVKPLQDASALEKSRVVLDCTVSNPRCSIRWYRGINVVLPSERFEICSEGCYRKLIIQQVALEDEGTYSVQVGDYTCSAKLTVEAQSVLMVRELRDVAVSAPDDACFECEVSAPAARAPAWSLNGEPLQPGPRVRLEKTGTVHRLTLRQTAADMSGLVEFTSGKARSQAQLRVAGNP
ncbi:obscurin-like protein 1 isoform X10 [Xiphophorus couchianus]|uniref:obscurin-like protein 1 isoform X10 n=1 Tax=Xiphophorus couchianus TaxID=32473 RepID=UPI0010168E10|nr:obscurin-like protein 1 isoform X10 [Xiphophorus couchianus]